MIDDEWGLDTFEKVYSPEKRDKIIAILKDTHPKHEARVWLVFFLKYVGYSKEEVYDIICRENNWIFDSKGHRKPFSPDITWRQICSIYRTKGNKPQVKDNSIPAKRAVSEAMSGANITEDAVLSSAIGRKKDYKKQKEIQISAARISEARIKAIKILPGGIDKEITEKITEWLRANNLPVYE